MEDTKSFTKLFKTPLGHNCYDYNRYCITKISNSLYKYLADNREINFTIKREIKQLRDRRYFLKRKTKKILHPFNNITEVMLNDNLERITLQVTQKCNLTCSYCPNINSIKNKKRKGSSKSIILGIRKKSIVFLSEHSILKNRINIGFCGDEHIMFFEKVNIPI